MLSDAQRVAIASQRERLQARLHEMCGGDILFLHPLERYVQALDQTGVITSYHKVPDEITAFCRMFESEHGGAQAMDLYHRLLMSHLVAQCEERAERYRIAVSIRTLMPAEFMRILALIDTAPVGFCRYPNELFVKDLALCRQKMLPCGSEFLDLDFGMPRSWMLRGGVTQLFSLGGFAMRRLGGFRPLYEMHWDRRLARQFNESDYNRTYRRVADMLALHPQVKGVFGASWWLDPAVEQIAPEFSFLRRVPEAEGARVFRVGPDAAATRDAITFSKRRRALYEAGQYQPCRYMLVWERRDLLDWARRNDGDA